MELIACLTQAFADERNAVSPRPMPIRFSVPPHRWRGPASILAAERDRHVCVDALLAAVQPDTRIVFVANPGNPTGTRIPRHELVRLREGLPGISCW